MTDTVDTPAAEVDVVVVGGGPGGYAAAVRAAQLGGKVVLVEKEELGGACLNKGCIPIKTFLESVRLLFLTDVTRNFGINVNGVHVDLTSVTKRKNEVVNGIAAGMREIAEKIAGLDLIKGNGTVAKPGLVNVARDNGDVEKIKCRNIILAIGSKPDETPALSRDKDEFITINEALELKEVPRSMLIVDSGVGWGLELACIFNRLGSKVTVVGESPYLPSTVDEEIAETLQLLLEERGVNIFTKAKINEVIDTEENEKKVLISSEIGDSEIRAEKIILTARVPNADDIGLDAAIEKGRIAVNDQMETSVPGIYAVGDVVGRFQLAHVASAEGIVAAENAMGRKSVIDYKVIPRCISTIPEVASVGLTEKQAKENGYSIKVGKSSFASNAKAQIRGETEGLIKVIADAKFGEVLGVHIIGPGATELISEGVLALKLESTVEDIANTMHAHPTLAEALKDTAWRLFTLWEWL